MGILRFNFKCSHCDYKFYTGCITGFRHTDNNQKKHVFLSLRGEERKKDIREGIDGIKGRVYCDNCKDVFDIILLEYKTPVYDLNDLYNGSVELKEGYSYSIFKKILYNKYGFCEGYSYRNLYKTNKKPLNKHICPKCFKRDKLILHVRGWYPELDCKKCNIGKITIDWIDCLD